MVLNTSELLPEPETPVNTVSRRFGSSTLTSLRLFTRAPCTRIRSCRSATCGVDPVERACERSAAAGCLSVLVAMLSGSGGRYSRVLEQPEHVAVRVGEGGHQAAATDVMRGLLHGGTRGGHLG